MFRLMKATRIGTSSLISRHQMMKFSSQIEDKFKSAQENLKKLGEDPDNAVKLKLYGLFKQATLGECKDAKPSAFNLIAKAKWEAWATHGNLSNEDAMKQYVGVVDQLLKDNGITVGDGVSSGASAGTQKEPPLLVEKVDSVCYIRLNRPKKFNALTQDMYGGIVSALEDAARDESIKIAVLTASGDFYCSGNDLSNFQQMASQHGGDLEKGAQLGGKILQQFVAAFIDFPKPLIGAVNGPAIGISVTTLALMDCVIASDSATFYTPFSGLGQTPEACATYTFPKIMGPSLASQMLLFNHTMTAQEADKCGLVAKVVPKAQFESYLKEWIHGEKGLVKNCYPKTMFASKGMIRDKAMRDKLHQVNKVECDTIARFWIGEECMQALQKFFTRKSNL